MCMRAFVRFTWVQYGPCQTYFALVSCRAACRSLACSIDEIVRRASAGIITVWSSLERIPWPENVKRRRPSCPTWKGPWKRTTNRGQRRTFPNIVGHSPGQGLSNKASRNCEWFLLNRSFFVLKPSHFLVRDTRAPPSFSFSSYSLFFPK